MHRGGCLGLRLLTDGGVFFRGRRGRRSRAGGLHGARLHSRHDVRERRREALCERAGEKADAQLVEDGEGRCAAAAAGLLRRRRLLQPRFAEEGVG